MEQSQAQQFAQAYTILHQQPNTTTGFSATLFQEQGGGYTLAIRGTEITGDFINDVLLTDLADIGGKGIAARQAVDLFNYYQQLITPVSSQAFQLELVIEQSITLPDSANYVILDAGTGPVPIPTYMYMQPTTTATGLGVLSSTDTFNVAGHSLGGQLAMIMGRMFTANVNEVYTYNAPGFDTGFSSSETDWFFNALTEIQTNETGSSTVGATFPTGQMNNLVIPGDLISDIGSIPGGQIPFESEATNPANAHFISTMTDALVLYPLFELADGSATVGAINNFVSASSNQVDQSLEGLLFSLTELYEFNYSSIGLNDNWQNWTRDEYYQIANAMEGTIGDVQTLPTLIDLTDGSVPLITAAQNDIGVRYALENFNPFALTGDASLYINHNQNGELDIENFSDQYLTDRINFFTGIMQLNQSDTNYLPSSNLANYYDYENDTDLPVGALFPLEPFRENYIFGDDEKNVIEGGKRDDSLYGAGGNDTITAGGGEDYIEGGAGNDVINAQDEKQDFIVGGKDADVYNIDHIDIISGLEEIDTVNITGPAVQLSDVVVRSGSSSIINLSVPAYISDDYVQRFQISVSAPGELVLYGEGITPVGNVLGANSLDGLY